MKIYEVITLLAILAGPVFAVAVQLRAEKRKHTRDQQAITMRMLVSTRHMVSDPAYSTAINMIPIDFNRVMRVMTAHKAFVETVNFIPSDENRTHHNELIVTKQTKLIFAMTQHLGYDLPESDIQSTAYASVGFVDRDNLMTNGWRAWPRIAEALEAQNRAYIPEGTPVQTGEAN